MYYSTVTPAAKALIQQTSLALLSDGCEIKPSTIKSLTGSTLPIPVIRTLIDELYEKDVTIKRKLTTEGQLLTFLYTKQKALPASQAKALKYGYIVDLDLTKYDPNIYVAYHKYSQFVSAAIFNTTDKYTARNFYKSLAGPSIKHNDVRMVKLSSFLKK